MDRLGKGPGQGPWNADEIISRLPGARAPFALGFWGRWRDRGLSRDPTTTVPLAIPTEGLDVRAWPCRRRRAVVEGRGFGSGPLPPRQTMIPYPRAVEQTMKTFCASLRENDRRRYAAVEAT